jgi:hypothetical protein
MSESNQPPRHPQQPQHPAFQPAGDQHGLGVPPEPPQPGQPSQDQPSQDQYPTAPVPVGGPPMMGDVPAYDRGTPGAGRRNLVLAAVIALVVGLGAGYAFGRQTAPKGASSLAEAIQLAGQGKLPTGDLAAARGNGGLGGLFRRGAQGGQGGQGQGQNGQTAPGAGGNGSGGNNGQGGGFLFGGGQRNGGIQATVSSVSGDTVTLETAAGQLRVRIGSSTKIQKATKGARSDITPGSRVLVNFDLNGSQSDDGSVGAASILAEGKAS